MDKHSHDRPEWAENYKGGLISYHGRTKHQKPGRGYDASRAHFALRKGAVPESEKGITLFSAKSWRGRAPGTPNFYVYVSCHR